jgi:hypothetical protein
MPIPINPVGSDSNGKDKDFSKLQMDYAFLLGITPQAESNKRIVTASDKDADVLMQIWLTAEKTEDSTFKIKDDNKVSSQDVVRLKSHGLLTGGTNEVKITPRGKLVITTMALGENNGFLKNQKSKSYTEIMASMSKKGKPGYRMPTYASNTHLIRVSTSQDNQDLVDIFQSQLSTKGKFEVGNEQFYAFDEYSVTASEEGEMLIFSFKLKPYNSQYSAKVPQKIQIGISPKNLNVYNHKLVTGGDASIDKRVQDVLFEVMKTIMPEIRKVRSKRQQSIQNPKQ